MNLAWYMPGLALLLLNQPGQGTALSPGLAGSTITLVRAGNLTWILAGDMRNLRSRYGHWNRKRVVSVNVLNQAESDILLNLTTVIDDAYFAVTPLLLAKPTDSTITFVRAGNLTWILKGT
ncbi:hypothetical protein BV898_15158 [Hypsibius exemplaris]|uniref:Uncharacterized protein n=1 Tax=Hypsibius exemplaris TaxID=2072580 RepID=A0A9X6NDH8_HYPEX|nr:hypothetical protein BV898_15158 [Hypsibius exemplaris]